MSEPVDEFEGLTPPAAVWVPDDWDRMRGHWLYPSQKQLAEFRKRVTLAKVARLSREMPL